MSEEPLPSGWALTKLGELFEFRGGGTPDRAQPKYWNGDIPWASVKDIKGSHLVSTIDWISEDGLRNSASSLAEIGDIVVVTRISPGEAVVSKIRCAINQDLKVVRPPCGMEPDFIRLLFKTLSPQIRSLSSGTTVLGIRLNELSSIPLELPPLPEQKRIVAKIEELISELEAGEESLRLARRQLGVYRQSLLKQAFEGKLTAKWRTQKSAQLESIDALLLTAADNRRERWNGRGKYQPAKGPKLDAERPIPECWAHASVDQVTVNFDGQRVPLKREHRDKRSGAYPYYGASGIIDDIDDYLFDGDYLLIAEDGANLLSRSTPIAFPAHGKFWVNNHAHIVQTVSTVLMRYLEFFLNGQDLTRFITGTAQPKLTQANLDQVPIPLCSLPEQQEIVRLLDAQFEMIERNEREIDGALRKSGALRQAILKKAFAGRLVPQSPDDEPASALLARLRAGRTSTSAPPRHRASLQ